MHLLMVYQKVWIQRVMNRIEGSIKIIEKNFNDDVSKQLSNIAKDVEKSSGKNKLSDDLT